MEKCSVSFVGKNVDYELFLCSILHKSGLGSWQVEAIPILGLRFNFLATFSIPLIRAIFC